MDCCRRRFEAVTTSLVLILSPSLFGWLILGAELSEAGQALGRLTGIVLLALLAPRRQSPNAGTQPATTTLIEMIRTAHLWLL